MNSKHADNNVVEEIYEEYTVTSRNSKEQITVFEVNRHKKLIEDHIIDPIQQNIEKAGAEDKCVWSLHENHVNNQGL